MGKFKFNPWPGAGEKSCRLRSLDAWRLLIVFVTRRRWRARQRLKVSAGKQFVLVTFACVTRTAASHSSCFVLSWQHTFQTLLLGEDKSSSNGRLVCAPSSDAGVQSSDAHRRKLGTRASCQLSAPIWGNKCSTLLFCGVWLMALADC